MANRSHWIDPSEAEVRQHVQGVLPAQGRPDPTPLFAPEDGLHGVPLGDDLFQVARWTDPLGRKHWVFEWVLGGGYEYWFDEQQPLGWRKLHLPPLSRLAGPLQSAYWRPANRPEQFVVLCRCGLIGPPAQLLWMGTQCGACHDLEQEAQRIRPPQSPPADHHLLDVTNGRWISNHIDWPEQTLRAYDPEQQRLLWQRPWLTEARFVAGQGWIVALEGREATVLVAETGEGYTVLSSPIEVVGAAVLNHDEIALLHPGSISVWSLAEGGERRGVWSISPLRGESLLASPDGEELAVVSRDEIRLVDREGRLRVRLQRPNAQGFREAAWQGDSVYALTPTFEQVWISRWQPDVRLPVMGQFPAAGVPVGDLASRFRVAPKGQLLVRADTDRLSFHDARSLELLGQLLFCEGQVDDLAFDEAGRLVLAGGGTLLGIWCREGLGLPWPGKEG
ncbi:MAG: hypothetical protein SNJ82_01580 [Gemmataceae bacterium]